MLQTGKYDYLLGLTESAAYEIAQDEGFVVRITRRDAAYMVCTRDVRDNRINFEVTDNRVVSWKIG